MFSMWNFDFIIIMFLKEFHMLLEKKNESETKLVTHKLM